MRIPNDSFVQRMYDSQIWRQEVAGIPLVRQLIGITPTTREREKRKEEYACYEKFLDIEDLRLVCHGHPFEGSFQVKQCRYDPYV